MTEVQLKKLMDGLTIEEKVGQLVQLSGDFYTQHQALKVGPQQKLGIEKWVVEQSGSVLNVVGADQVRQIQKAHMEKSKIPLLFMADVVYGYKTVFPIPLGLGATWNPELVGKAFDQIAQEVIPAGVHVTFSPMVDLVRDARWGRCLESTGEDFWLNSRFAEAMVKGFQGEHLDATHGIASCVKHFAGYGAVEAGREYNTVDLSERRLREEYLPAYRAAVDAGCEMVMTAFNTVDGIPATANRWLMHDVLRQEWGFDGVVITDYAAIDELIAHGVAEDQREAAKLAMEATVDIDMKTACYANHLADLVRDGKISQQCLDDAVWRVLKLKNKLGLFEDPYRGADEAEEAKQSCSAEHRAMARKVAQEALVLLKNEGDVLPLKKVGVKYALIGPYSESQALIGLWAVHARQQDVITLKDALEEVVGEEHLKSALGCRFLEDESGLGQFGHSDEEQPDPQILVQRAKAQRDQALKVAQEADIVIMALGEHPMQSGEGGSRTDLTLPTIQQELLRDIHKLGKKIVLLVFSGRPLVLTETEKYADAVLEMWFPGTEGAHAAADILCGEVNPSGRLTMSFPYAVGQVPVYYNAFSTGRPAVSSSHSSRFTSRYVDCPNDPLYPFGYGLSYHTAEYRNLTLSDTKFQRGGSLMASVDVQNTGNVAGMETVQLYIRDVTGSVVRPIQELRDFQKVWLHAGETKTVVFQITEEMLKFHTKDMTYQAEPGKFVAMVGPNSKMTLNGEFWLE